MEAEEYEKILDESISIFVEAIKDSGLTTVDALSRANDRSLAVFKAVRQAWQKAGIDADTLSCVFEHLKQSAEAKAEMKPDGAVDVKAPEGIAYDLRVQIAMAFVFSEIASEGAQFLPYPTHQILQHTKQIISRQGVISGDNVKVLKHGNKIRYIFAGEGGEYEITVDEDIISKNNITFSKFFEYTLMKAKVQHFPEYIVIDLREMVPQWFSNVNNAARAYRDFIEKTKSINFVIRIKKDRIICEYSKQMYIDTTRINNLFYIQTNPNFPLEQLAQNYVPFPLWAIYLSNTAYSIISRLFYLSRQSSNIEKLTMANKFAVSIESVLDYTCLPEIESTRKHKEKIKNPLLKAINEINEAAKQNSDIDGEFRISTERVADTRNINEWASGMLTIHMTGDYAKAQLKVHDSQCDFKEKSRSKRCAKPRKKSLA